jgi:hypothetical protein
MFKRPIMSFTDISKLNYQDYIRIAKQGPYRGTKAYPVGNRKYSARHFIITDEGVVQVWYHNLQTAETFRKTKVPPYIVNAHLLNIYPDNTFEFVNASGQGDNQMISQLTNAYVRSECARGGTVISRSGVLHPVFKGLRLSLTDMSIHPSSQYQLKYRKIIPAKRKEVMADYAKQLKVGRSMLSVLEVKNIEEVYHDLRNTYIEIAKAGNYKKPTENYITPLLEEARQNNHYLDVLIYTGMIGGFNGAYASNVHKYLFRIDQASKKGVNTYLRSKPELFTYVYREPNDFPTSATWGMDVVVNGTNVTRF